MTTEKRIATNGIELHTVTAGDGFPVVLSHGFPELGYSWRHQIPALADAGYSVIVPDQRGYGQSDIPTELTDYDIPHLTDDLLGLLDALGHEKAVFVGHDWGSMVVWQMALLHPERTAGVVGMSVPFMPRSAMAPVQMMRQIFADNFFYIVYFQDPGVADAELAADVDRTMRRLMGATTTNLPEGTDMEQAAIQMAANDGRGFVDRLPDVRELPDWITEDELAVYVKAFETTGFTGPLNWYRNMDRNWELAPQLDGAHVTVPSAFITGSADPVSSMAPTGATDEFLNDHRGATVVEGAGHWVQQEAPDEVNAALLRFLGSLDL